MLLHSGIFLNQNYVEISFPAVIVYKDFQTQYTLVLDGISLFLKVFAVTVF